MGLTEATQEIHWLELVLLVMPVVCLWKEMFEHEQTRSLGSVGTTAPRGIFVGLFLA